MKKDEKKVYDFDGMFDRQLGKFIEESEGKYSEKQWEEMIPKLYQKFGNTVYPRIGKTPRAYYADMTVEELVEELKAHYDQGVPVSDFLCSAMEEKDCTPALLSFLDDEREEVVQYAINMIGSDARAYSRYLNLIIGSDASDDVKELAIEKIKEDPDPVKRELLQYYYDDVEREFMLEMLSRLHEKDDIVYQVILDEFLLHLEDIPMHASYLAAYGDKRALPYLTEQIEREDINYIEFQELKYAIEALGGEYNEPRDFSSDPYYAQVHTGRSDLFERFGGGLGAEEGEEGESACDA
ncbi:MAG: hypothetical protein ACI4U2_01370 [Christensenellaceae bacterium]